MKNVKTIVSATILTVAFIAQIMLSFFLYSAAGNPILRNIGWGVLWISAVFGWLPIFTLRRWGKVPAGKAYVHTTGLVDRGVYAVVRHPQYLAGMLLAVALVLISQHWLVAVLGAVAFLQTYMDTLAEDKACLAKFGEEYSRYMERVVRVNFVRGLVRLLLRQAGKPDDPAR